MSRFELYWLDIETTGLLPGVPYAQILEIAVAQAELKSPFELNHIYHAVFKPTDPELTWAYMDPFVREMHTKSGLWEACLASRLSVSPQPLSDLIPAIADHSDKPTLAGSSVHFDHAWVRYYMGSEFASRFSHRHYDVSAVKLFCQSLGMESAAHGKLCAEWIAQYGFAQHNIQILGALRDE